MRLTRPTPPPSTIPFRHPHSPRSCRVRRCVPHNRAAPPHPQQEEYVVAMLCGFEGAGGTRTNACPTTSQWCGLLCGAVWGIEVESEQILKYIQKTCQCVLNNNIILQCICRFLALTQKLRFYHNFFLFLIFTQMFNKCSTSVSLQTHFLD